MEYKTILVLPTGQFNIDGETKQFDDKFEYIIDNFKNPYVPNAKVLYQDKEIGSVVDYSQMDDGIYCKLELNDSLDITNKYPVAILDTYMDADGQEYKFVLRNVELNDTPQYAGNEYKQLNKELQVPNPSDYNSEGEWMQVCVPKVVEEGKDQEQAVAVCKNIWISNKDKDQQIKDFAEAMIPEGDKATTPTKKSKIEVLNSIKKLIEKSGYGVSDEKILEMFGVIQDNKGSLTKLNKKLDSSKSTHEIKVFPRKTVHIEKYNEKIEFNDVLFNEMIAAFKRQNLFKPYMDVDHELKEKYADIIELYAKEDGLYAKIELNEKGRNAIKNNEYSYISPEWGDRTDTDGVLHKNVLWAITLTNIPALEGENPRLQDQIKLNKINKDGKFMDLTTRLASLQGKVSNYKLAEGDAPVMSPEIMEAIQMIKDALVKIDELTMQNQEVIEEKEAALLAKETAEKIATDYKGKFDQIELEKSEAEKEAFFTDVVSKGQLEPSEVEDWRLQYGQSKDFVRKILSSRPVRNSGQTQLTNTPLDNAGDIKTYNGKKYKLTSEDYTIMEKQGFDKSLSKDIERYIRDVNPMEVK